MVTEMFRAKCSPFVTQFASRHQLFVAKTASRFVL